MWNEIMEQSNRMNNISGLLGVIVALIIQSWFSIIDVTDGITSVNTLLFSFSLVLLITGSVLLATTNISRLFAIYHRINYAIAMIGLVGLCIFLVFGGYLESILFPRPMVVYVLIQDFLWIFFLGLLLKRFQTTANKRITQN
jgi:hypothetical protein